MRYRNRRFPTRFAIKLSFGDTSFPATIFSVSAGGAGLTLEQTPEIGQAATLTCFGTRIDGNIRWVSPNKAGIAFSRILSRSELDRIRYGIKAATSSQPYRTKFMEFR